MEGMKGFTLVELFLAIGIGMSVFYIILLASQDPLSDEYLEKRNQEQYEKCQHAVKYPFYYEYNSYISVEECERLIEKYGHIIPLDNQQ